MIVPSLRVKLVWPVNMMNTHNIILYLKFGGAKNGELLSVTFTFSSVMLTKS